MEKYTMSAHPILGLEKVPRVWLIRGAPDDREAKMREFAPSLRRRRSAQKFFSVESARVTFVEKLIQAMIMHMNRGWKWDVLSMGPPRWVVR
jgi:hypothetical protein